MKKYCLIQATSIPSYKVLVLRSGMYKGEALAMFCRLRRNLENRFVLVVANMTDRDSLALHEELPPSAC